MTLRRLNPQEDYDEAWKRLRRFKGHMAMNIGANIGQAARHISGQFEKVFAFEPCVESWCVAHDESPKNVTVFNVAVSDHDGHVTLDECESTIDTGQLTTGTGLHWGEVTGQREIECVTIDTFCAVWGKPDLIQMDCEGHEVAVVKGGLETIHTFHPDLFVEIHKHENALEIINLCPDYEWEIYRWPGTRPNSVLFDHYWIAGERRHHAP